MSADTLRQEHADALRSCRRPEITWYEATKHTFAATGMARPRMDGGAEDEQNLQVIKYLAPLAQLDRASDYESEGQRFKSSRARHSKGRDFHGVSVVGPGFFLALIGPG
jgi:hypothetical protein